MKIERKRWVIMRNNRTEIFCGLARHYEFKPVDNIGNTAIKTYLSENKALSSFESSWGRIDFDFEAVAVNETIETAEHEADCKLAGHTDTGLTPDQIREIDRLYLEKCEEVNQLRNELDAVKRGQSDTKILGSVALSQEDGWELREVICLARIADGYMCCPCCGQSIDWSENDER